jgi:hypothetical protein
LLSSLGGELLGARLATHAGELGDCTTNKGLNDCHRPLIELPTMKPATGQLQPSEKIDYNPMLGFIEPAVRIDPHTHEMSTESQPDLRQVADIIRARRHSGRPETK